MTPTEPSTGAPARGPRDVVLVGAGERARAWLAPLRRSARLRVVATVSRGAESAAPDLPRCGSLDEALRVYPAAALALALPPRAALEGALRLAEATRPGIVQAPLHDAVIDADLGPGCGRRTSRARLGDPARTARGRSPHAPRRRRAAAHRGRGAARRGRRRPARGVGARGGAGARPSAARDGRRRAPRRRRRSGGGSGGPLGGRGLGGAAAPGDARAAAGGARRWAVRHRALVLGGRSRERGARRYAAGGPALHAAGAGARPGSAAARRRSGRRARRGRGRPAAGAQLPLSAADATADRRAGTAAVGVDRPPPAVRSARPARFARRPPLRRPATRHARARLASRAVRALGVPRRRQARRFPDRAPRRRRPHPGLLRRRSPANAANAGCASARRIAGWIAATKASPASSSTSRATPIWRAAPRICRPRSIPPPRCARSESWSAIRPAASTPSPGRTTAPTTAATATRARRARGRADGTTPIPWPWELNNLHTMIVPFYPCSYRCERALAWARACLTEMARTHPAFVDELRAVLARPVLYFDHDHQLVFDGEAAVDTVAYRAVVLTPSAPPLLGALARRDRQRRSADARRPAPARRTREPARAPSGPHRPGPGLHRAVRRRRRPIRNEITQSCARCLPVSTLPDNSGLLQACGRD